MDRRSDYEIYIDSQQAGYVGGGYFNPIEEFYLVSRDLVSKTTKNLLSHHEFDCNQKDVRTFYISNLFKDLQSLLLPNESLFGSYDKGDYKIAVFLRSEERLLDFEHQVIYGNINRIGFFGVDDQYVDKGLMQPFVSSDLS